ncbi:MAG: EVE domain-containing protein [Euryarchaeota archaeon]|nr:EVE domain-containing protein [Euryarchaeota archaeon]
MRNLWLMKSEPHVYSYEDLVADGRTHWDGVRNYQARNMMRDQMKVGDLVLYYHSNTKPPHVAGVARVAREGYPDHTALDSSSKYFDPKATADNPRWSMVDLVPVAACPSIVSLESIKSDPAFEGMPLIRRGQRLSIQPVEEDHFRRVLMLAGLDAHDVMEE